MGRPTLKIETDRADESAMESGNRLIGRMVRLVVPMLALALPAQGVAGFGDVPEGEFYTPGVQWMVDEGITSGPRPGCFEPEATVSRAEAATFLHRDAGSPSAPATSFSDVPRDAFFASAVDWMVATGITTGIGGDRFGPDVTLDRGSLATFLHRAAGSPPAGNGGFVDVPDTAFYAEAVGWMVSAGITTGTGPTTFEPHRAISRGELAAMLYRYAGSPGVAIDPSGFCDDMPDLTAAEEASFQMLNDLRAQLGLSRLVRDPGMDAAARNWSRTMDAGSFEHSDLPYYENIAWWSNGSLAPASAALRMHEMWVDSPGHYSNMTRSGHTRVGIGFWRSERGWHATHVFSS